MNDVAKTESQPAHLSSPQAFRNFVAPPANITATENEFLIELEMPGVSKEGVEVTVEGNELSIIGRRKQELPDGHLVYSETPLLANYRRMFDLSPEVDTSKIRADMDRGVLKLHLPKREDAKRRKIEVSG